MHMHISCLCNRAETESALARRLSKFLSGCDTFYDEKPLDSADCSCNSLPTAPTVAAAMAVMQSSSGVEPSGIVEPTRHSKDATPAVATALGVAPGRVTGCKRRYPTGDLDGGGGGRSRADDSHGGEGSLGVLNGNHQRIVSSRQGHRLAERECHPRRTNPAELTSDFNPRASEEAFEAAVSGKGKQRLQKFVEEEKAGPEVATLAGVENRQQQNKKRRDQEEEEEEEKGKQKQQEKEHENDEHGSGDLASTFLTPPFINNAADAARGRIEDQSAAVPPNSASSSTTAGSTPGSQPSSLSPAITGFPRSSAMSMRVAMSMAAVATEGSSAAVDRGAMDACARKKGDPPRCAAGACLGGSSLSLSPSGPPPPDRVPRARFCFRGQQGKYMDVARGDGFGGGSRDGGSRAVTTVLGRVGHGELSARSYDYRGGADALQVDRGGDEGSRTEEKDAVGGEEGYDEEDEMPDTGETEEEPNSAAIIAVAAATTTTKNTAVAAEYPSNREARGRQCGEEGSGSKTSHHARCTTGEELAGGAAGDNGDPNFPRRCGRSTTSSIERENYANGENAHERHTSDSWITKMRDGEPGGTAAATTCFSGSQNSLCSSAPAVEEGGGGAETEMEMGPDSNLIRPGFATAAVESIIIDGI